MTAGPIGPGPMGCSHWAGTNGLGPLSTARWGLLGRAQWARRGPLGETLRARPTGPGPRAGSHAALWGGRRVHGAWDGLGLMYFTLCSYVVHTMVKIHAYYVHACVHTCVMCSACDLQHLFTCCCIPFSNDAHMCISEEKSGWLRALTSRTHGPRPPGPRPMPMPMAMLTPMPMPQARAQAHARAVPVDRGKCPMRHLI